MFGSIDNSAIAFATGEDNAYAGVLVRDGDSFELRFTTAPDEDDIRQHRWEISDGESVTLVFGDEAVLDSTNRTLTWSTAEQYGDGAAWIRGLPNGDEFSVYSLPSIHTAVYADSTDLGNLPAEVSHIHELVGGLHSDLGRVPELDGESTTFSLGHSGEEFGVSLSSYGGTPFGSITNATVTLRQGTNDIVAIIVRGGLLSVAFDNPLSRVDIVGHRFEVADASNSSILYADDATLALNLNKPVLSWALDQQFGDPLTWLTELADTSTVTFRSLAPKSENVYSLSAADLAAIQAALATIQSTTADTNADLVANTAIVTDTNADLVTAAGVLDEVQEGVGRLESDVARLRDDVGRSFLVDGMVAGFTKGNDGDDSGYRNDRSGPGNFGAYDGTQVRIAGELRTFLTVHRPTSQVFQLRFTDVLPAGDELGHRFLLTDGASSTVLYGGLARRSGSDRTLIWTWRISRGTTPSGWTTSQVVTTSWCTASKTSTAASTPRRTRSWPRTCGRTR